MCFAVLCSRMLRHAEWEYNEPENVPTRKSFATNGKDNREKYLYAQSGIAAFAKRIRGRRKNPLYKRRRLLCDHILTIEPNAENLYHNIAVLSTNWCDDERPQF